MIRAVSIAVVLTIVVSSGFAANIERTELLSYDSGFGDCGPLGPAAPLTPTIPDFGIFGERRGGGEEEEEEEWEKPQEHAEWEEHEAEWEHEQERGGGNVASLHTPEPAVVWTTAIGIGALLLVRRKRRT
jgi:hypothetical protein